MMMKLLQGLGLWTSWSTCSSCCKYTASRTRTCTDGQCSASLSEEKTVTKECG